MLTCELQSEPLFVAGIGSSSDQGLKRKIADFEQVLSIHLRREEFTMERHKIQHRCRSRIITDLSCLSTDMLCEHQVDRSFLRHLFRATHIRPVEGDIDLTGPDPAVT